MVQLNIDLVDFVLVVFPDPFVELRRINLNGGQTRSFALNLKFIFVVETIISNKCLQTNFKFFLIFSKGKQIA